MVVSKRWSDAGGYLTEDTYEEGDRGDDCDAVFGLREAGVDDERAGDEADTDTRHGEEAAREIR